MLNRKRTPLDFVRTKRWAYWTPWCLMEARQHPDPAGILALLAERHRSRLATLREAGISDSAVAHNDSDDPRLSTAAWESLFRAIVERHYRRVGYGHRSEREKEHHYDHRP